MPWQRQLKMTSLNYLDNKQISILNGGYPDFKKQFSLFTEGSRGWNQFLVTK